MKINLREYCTLTHIYIVRIITVNRGINLGINCFSSHMVLLQSRSLMTRYWTEEYVGTRSANVDDIRC